ncbi:hypothetical protein, partial [Plasmodium yoelii yoelii]
PFHINDNAPLRLQIFNFI